MCLYILGGVIQNVKISSNLPYRTLTYFHFPDIVKVSLQKSSEEEVPVQAVPTPRIPAPVKVPEQVSEVPKVPFPNVPPPPLTQEVPPVSGTLSIPEEPEEDIDTGGMLVHQAQQFPTRLKKPSGTYSLS